MFYDALIDLGIDGVKAKTMYYAVYLAGPKWVELVPGENCGQNCIKTVAPNGLRWEGDQYGSKAFQEEVLRVKVLVEASPDISLNELEERAENRKPNDFFYKHGSTYAPTGPSDPNVFSAQ